MELITPESIRSLRQRLGLTQEQLAARLGCSTQAVSFWERGTRTPTGLYAQAMRRVFADTEALTSAPPEEPRSSPPAHPSGPPSAGR